LSADSAHAENALNEGIEQMDQATPTNAVIWRVDERRVAYITLNRPQVYNAYDDDLIAALLIAFDKFAGEPVRAAVITGECHSPK
jgi:enoyl-CoA hydratase/carnithine racemase